MTALAAVAATADRVGTTRSRKAKAEVIAGLLASLDRAEVPIVVGLLVGVPRQGRLGTGWSTVDRTDAEPAAEPTLTVDEVDAVFDAIAAEAGPGSEARRADLLSDLLERATADEQRIVVAALLGEPRRGAQEGVVVDAVAQAADLPASLVRRAHMLGGSLAAVAQAALDGGRAALEGMGLEVFRPVRPMLATTAPDLGKALEDLGEATVEWKLDGARVQVHLEGDTVRVYTRSLREVTAQVPEVVETARRLDVGEAVLDGEAIALDSEGRPLPFQVTMGRFGSGAPAEPALTVMFFDLLRRDGIDLIDDPWRERRDALLATVGDAAVPSIVAGGLEDAGTFQADALDRGHEGVMVKALDAPYVAGRRGKAWRKVKPAHTLDLVVLAVEWGSGRREGWLSNLHLGARADEGFVMLGKTFKGLTDEMLEWQTKRFLSLETRREGHVVHVRPEQVVEVAFDGVQASRRYPAGMALRFTRVKGYRSDKSADEADTVETVRTIFEG